MTKQLVRWGSVALLLLGACSDDGAANEPVVSLAIAPAAITETPEVDVTFTLTLDRDPPEGGVRVYVVGDVPQSLTQLDLLALSWSPMTNAPPGPDIDLSGFTLLMTSREVTLTLPSYEDGDDEADVTVTYRVVPFDDVPWGTTNIDSVEAAGTYAVDPAAGSATLTYRDAP